jgi:integrase
MRVGRTGTGRVVGGAPRVQRGGFGSEEAAVEALERALERLRREQGLVEAPRLGEFVDFYLSQHGGQPETVEKLRWLLSKAVKVFGHRRINQLEPTAIAAWRMTIPARPRFEATQALRQVLGRAVTWRMIDMNPANQGIDNPQPRWTEKRPFESWDDLDALATLLGPKYGPLVLFAAATGLRPGEWIALEHRDIDRQGRAVYVCRAWRNGRLKDPKTTSSVRAVPLQAAALAALDRSPAGRGGSLVFPSPNGGYLDLHNFRNRLEAGAGSGRSHAGAAGLRSAAHFRDLCAPCRYLDVRPLTFHGNEPHHDRPPLRPPCQRQQRSRNPAPGHLPRRVTQTRRPRGGRRVEVALPLRRQRCERKRRSSRGKTSSPLTDSNR